MFDEGIEISFFLTGQKQIIPKNSQVYEISGYYFCVVGIDVDKKEVFERLLEFIQTIYRPTILTVLYKHKVLLLKAEKYLQLQVLF